MALYEFDGKKPRVEADSFIHPDAVLIGDIKVGHRSSVQDNSVIHVYPGSRVVIEDDVTIAHGVILHDVHIKSRCVIGMGSILLFGAVCEEDVFVSVGSIVPKGMMIPAGKIVAGNPAKITHDVTEDQKMMAKAGIDYYRELCRKYIATMKAVS
jgi:phenylacetic acid degradation protein